MELWVPVNGYEGLYEVSDKGNVKSLRKNLILRPNTRNGYHYVNLYKDGKANSIYVHRIVALSFIPNLECLEQVNHIDCCKLNNFPSNLQWVTRSRNISHAHKHGMIKTIGEKNGNSKLKRTDAIKIKKLYSEKKQSPTEIAKLFGISKTHFYRIINNKSWKNKEVI